MDKAAEKKFKEFLAEMGERKLHAFVLSLVKKICQEIRSEEFQFVEETHARTLFAGETPLDVTILNDPVVAAFNRQIFYQGQNLPGAFYQATRDLGQKTIGWAFENRPSVGLGGSRIADLLKVNSLEHFSSFVDIVCKSSLEKIISSTDRDFNFIGHDIYAPMYSIDLEFNAITSYQEEYKCYFTADDFSKDGLITHDISLIIDHIHQAIEFELDKLEKISFDESTSFRDTLLITAIKIRRNDTPILEIPFKLEDFDSSVNPNVYDVEFRRNLNSKPRENYVPDYENIKVCEADSSELRTLAKSLPRHAAMKLRGMSVEQDLGM